MQSPGVRVELTVVALGRARPLNLSSLDAADDVDDRPRSLAKCFLHLASIITGRRSPPSIKREETTIEHLNVVDGPAKVVRGS